MAAVCSVVAAVCSVVCSVVAVLASSDVVSDCLWQPMDAKSLIKLCFHKNADGKDVMATSCPAYSQDFLP